MPYSNLAYFMCTVNCGLTQLVYAIPVAVVLSVRGRRRSLKTFAIVCGLLFCATACARWR